MCEWTENLLPGVEQEINGSSASAGQMVPLPVPLPASPPEKSDLFQPEAVLHECSEDPCPEREQSAKPSPIQPEC